MEEATGTIFGSYRVYGQVVIDLTDSRKQIPNTTVRKQKGNPIYTSGHPKK